MRNFLVLFMLLGLVHASGAPTSADQLTMQEGANISLSATAGPNSTLTISSTDTDENVKVSSDDTSAGFLNGKLVGGAGITLTEGNGGANETLTIAAPETLTTKGDVLVHDGTSEARLAVGASGQFLTSDSTGALLWANPAEGGQLFNSNVLLNTYRTAENGSRPVLKIIDGAVDAFETETGVDTSASTNESYTGNLYTSTRSGTPIQFVGLDATLDNFLNRGGDLTGITDGKKGTVSFWFRSVAATGNQFILTNGGNSKEGVTIYQSTTAINISLRDASNFILWLSSGPGSFEIGTLIHVFASWDLGANKADIYINGVNKTGTPAITNSNIDYTAVNWKVGDRTNAANFQFKGDLGQLWFDTKYVDPSTDLNKFYNNGSVELGSDGSTPTGTSPKIFLNNSFSTWQNNLGTGGNFSVVGSPDDAGAIALGEADNLTLVSNSQTAKTEPNGANILLMAEDVNADITINTDVKASVSRDGGTTFTQVTLSDAGEFEKGNLLTGTVDISGQPTGTDMEWKVETLNNKLLNLHGVGLEWR